MKVQCSHCGKKYTLPKERVAGRILKIRCRQCSELFEVDGSNIVLSPQSVAQAIPILPSVRHEQDHGQQVSSIHSPPPSIQPPPQPQVVQPANPSSAALSVEVSQSAQEWMESVMSDIDRPITTEVSLDDITGHRSLPPENKSSTVIFAIIAVLIVGAVYVLSQITSTPKDAPKVVSLNLSTAAVEQPVKTAIIQSEKLPQKPVSQSDMGTTPINEKKKKVSEKTAPSKKNEVPKKSIATEKSKGSSSKAKPKKRKSKSSKTKLDELTRTLSNAKTERSQDLKLEGDLSSARSSSTKRRSKAASSGKLMEAKVSNPTKRKRRRSKSKAVSSKKRSKKGAKRSYKGGKGLERSTVKSVMNQNAGGLEHCYQKALKKDPNIGKVKTRLNFVVGTGGRVARRTIKLSGRHRKTRMESCIQNTVVRWYFPKAKGETPVRFPLNFTPGF